ncbi:hypothetical protein [Anaeromyxobacter diazotrophicus]|uniref:Uncharacterized protein n=1 Tax=Anaeromyxobacter diazotrophicus TaxID=2590199 RepID=A0A7I9VJG4_9BACT|nr:hypothetical protein [Anaeromyxobacter diazotrophicus]GEJ56505.1 hypothetical protein AMYX_12460 [Anaeromyxobacter diazotrophicus]
MSAAGAGSGGGCPKRAMCDAVFAHVTFAPSAGVVRALYCEARFEACERFRLAAAGRPVPPTLRPDGTERRSAGRARGAGGR